MNEGWYLFRRRVKGHIQSVPFYLFRLFPVDDHKVVFENIEGTVGYGCNPKYICDELLRRNGGAAIGKEMDLVWLVNDTSKAFPRGVRVVRNTLWNRARELATSKVWVDNSRKQLECRKRKGQYYIQTWHANVAIKPIGLDRGKSFSKIAYLVSKHDSDLIDLVLTDSKWYEEKVVQSGLLYTGETLRTGSPRVDILLNQREEKRNELIEKHHLAPDAKLIMYAPTFRGGSQSTTRSVAKNNLMPDFASLRDALHKRFGGEWTVLLRLHPQLTARHIVADASADPRIIDVSKEDDMFETLAGCDAFLSDYSASVFDAAYTRMPVFLYVPDLEDYRAERGELMWNLEQLPFPAAKDDAELADKILVFDEKAYSNRLDALLESIDLYEPGTASAAVADIVQSHLVKESL